MTPEEKFDWENLSLENLKIAQRVIKITLNFLQFQPTNRLPFHTEISLQKFENEQVCLDDVSGVLGRIDGIDVRNDELHYQVKQYQRTRVRFPSSITFDYDDLYSYLPSEERLKNYIFLQVDSLDGLKKAKNLLDEKLKIRGLEKKVALPKQKNKKNDLKSTEVKYDDDKATLEIGNKKCQIPPYKNEHYFYRAIDEHGANEPVDWSIIYEKMTGYYEIYYGKPQKTRENWRLVYDTMRALNKRIKRTINTDDNFFTWQEKTVKRNY